jgi:hypothetical protein
MNLTEAYKMLGVTPPVLPQPSERHRQRMRELQDDHDQKMRDLRQKADDRIASSNQHRTELVEENRLFKQQLREQTMERQRQDDRVALAERRGFRHFLEQLGRELGDLERRQLQDELEEEIGNPDDPQVKKMRIWLEGEEAAAGIDVRVCALAALRNGKASRDGNWIAIPPTQSLITAMIRAHEDGHELHPKIENERIVDGEFGNKISVPSELEAWRWVLDRTPVWTAEMHAFMKRCLDSYRSYANESEARAMDSLCSQLCFCEVQLRLPSASESKGTNHHATQNRICGFEPRAPLKRRASP